MNNDAYAARTWRSHTHFGWPDEEGRSVGVIIVETGWPTQLQLLKHFC